METNSEENKKDEEAILVEQWKTCVEMADSVSRRRDAMNALFVTVNLALVTALSIVFDVTAFFIAGIGLFLCIFWIGFILNYRNLNQAKFEVINEMEKKLPVQAFKDEWAIIDTKRKHKHIEQSKLEISIPIIFMALYIGLVLFVIFF